MDQKFLNVNDVAKRLKVTPKTVRLWVQLGKLKGTKLAGTTIRVLEEDLEVFIKEAKAHVPSH